MLSISRMRLGRLCFGGALGLMVLLTANDVHAGGYDTPILYSARHIGMGGTAVSSVDDASALFHNPAGLGNIGVANLILDTTLLVGKVRASPIAVGFPDAQSDNALSEPTIAPFFLAGGALRLHEMVVAGIAAYPVASAGATYEYGASDMGTNRIEDVTQLLFYEVSPGLALSLLDGDLMLGFSWRVTIVRLTRTQDLQIMGSDDVRQSGLEMRGASYGGFRVGAQYAPTDNLRVGIHYRHKTETEIEGLEDATLLSAFTFPDSRAEFILPSRLTFGAQGSVGDWRIAVDLEYGFNSQNDVTTVELLNDDGSVGRTLNNIFDWTDALTFRTGGEYTIADRWPVRVGYIFDGKTTSEAYPTAFGTPPTPTHIATLGFGFEDGPWRASFATAFRTGSTNVSQADIDNQRRYDVDGDGNPEGCDACGGPGDYEMNLGGIYLDLSYDWE